MTTSPNKSPASILSLTLLASTTACFDAPRTTHVDDEESSSSGTLDDVDPLLDTSTGSADPGMTSGPPAAESTTDDPTVGVCGDGIVDPDELCDDGNDDDTDACSTTCEPATCGDGIVWIGTEACDDGLNDGSYGGCNPDCTPGPWCGDGALHDAMETCDDGNADPSDGCLADCSVPTSCAQIKAFDPAAPDGSYLLDPNGDGQTLTVYCNMTHDGGGWQLVSSRNAGVGALFANYVCSDLEGNCSGTIRDEQLDPEQAPDLLLATNDGAYWVRISGLAPPGSDALLDVITLERPLTTSSVCEGNHYCNQNLEPLVAIASSEGYVPRYYSLISQFARYGGIWFGNGGGGADDHVVSFNYGTECGSGGLVLSDSADATFGNVVCGVPGAIYFRYADGR